MMPVLAVTIAAAIRWQFFPIIGEAPYVIFFPVVIISAFFGGLWPGLIAITLSAISAIVMAPQIQLPGGWAGMGVFLAGNLIITGICVLLRNAQEQLRNSEQRLRATFDNAALGIVEVDRDDHLIAANARALEILGYSRDELLSLNVHQLTAPEDRTNSDKINAQIHSGELDIVAYEKRYLKRDGSRLWARVTVSAMRDSNGNWVRSIGTVEEIGERKRAEEALRQSQEQFRRTMFAAPFPIMIHAEDGTVVAINDAWTEATGYRHAQIPTIADWTQSAYGERNDLVRAKIAQLYNLDHKFDEGEYVIRTANGDERIWAFSSAPLGQDAQGRRLVISMAADVTERKHTEEALREGERNLKQNREYLLRLTNDLKSKNDELESIVSITSHDLRSPVVNLMGFSGELARSTDFLKQKLLASNVSAYKSNDIMSVIESEIPEEITFIENSTRSIDKMLRSLSKVVHIVLADIKPRHVDMDHLIASIMTNFADKIKAAGIDVEIEQLPGCEADPVLLNEVFINLIDNAIKYMVPARPGKISVRGFVKNQYSIYCVEDNGRGIAPDHQHNIFKLFHRLEVSEQGEGIGLTISKRLIERQSGNIWVESEPDKGSKFFVALPRS